MKQFFYEYKKKYIFNLIPPLIDGNLSLIWVVCVVFEKKNSITKKKMIIGDGARNNFETKKKTRFTQVPSHD